GGSIGKYTIDVLAAPTSSSGNSGGGGSSGTAGPVIVQGSIATISGTVAADVFVWNAALPQQITINGAAYALGGATQIRLEGKGGSDTLTITGGSVAETVRLRPGSVEFVGGGFSLNATGVETARFYGGASDRAWLYDSAANDYLEAGPAFARLAGGGFESAAFGCGAVTVIAGSGNDAAALRDSAGADLLDANPSYVWLRGAGFSIRAEGFDDVTVQATAGSGDAAGFYGSAAGDLLWVWGGTRNLYAGGVQIRTEGFQSAYFDGAGGQDQIDFNSSGPQPRLRGRGSQGTIADGALATEFAHVESVLASVRKNHKLQTDLKAVDFVFRKIGGP
ncbi:MAG TPA: hypothetical protein VFB80_24020, partial [Pirellulaceae bacterium]|nr:hypothetical protein [Pirellulaceae bacterium]